MSLKHLREPSLEELDALLDEIDEVEKKKDEELRNSGIISKIPDTVVEEVNHEMKEEEGNNLNIWIRSIWIVGSKVEIYRDNWIKGVIEKIYTDDDTEWLQVKYEEGIAKVTRDDTRKIRPLSSALSIYKYVYDAIDAKNSTESMAVSTKASLSIDEKSVTRV